MMRHVAANALSFLIVGLVLLLALIAWGQSQFRAEGPLEEPLYFEVERGAGLSAISAALEEAGAIRDATVFRIGARYAALDEGLKFGEYEIPPGATMEEILELLNRGSNFVRRVVVPEGWTSWQVVELLRQRPELTGEVAEIPPEGSIAPAAYDVQRGDDRQALIDRMKAEQSRLLDEAWDSRDPDLPLESPEELLTLASLVEKETGQEEERGLVASVFVNRLNRGMRLQTDPAVIYGITEGRGTLGRGLMRSELVQATPYNTYVIPGLPPTPIANPGRESLQAAANPEESDYLFFVADGSGGHAFAETLEEHNANVAAWRRIEAERAAALEAEASEEAPEEPVGN
jgi:UPF0755 protein